MSFLDYLKEKEQKKEISVKKETKEVVKEEKIEKPKKKKLNIFNIVMKS